MTSRTIASIVALILFTLALPALAQERVESIEITGSVTYRQRIALPPDAVVLVRLEEVSRQDAPATSIAEEKIATGGKQVPIPFRLKYDPAKIEPSRTYHVRATISTGERLLFTSTTAYPVITRGATKKLDIMVQPVTAPDKAATRLEGTYWKLIKLKGEPVSVSSGGREPHLILRPEGKLGGSGGCNSFFGTYVTTPENLRLTPGGSTMMACPEPFMKQEQAFLSTLPLVTGYLISDDTLELLNGEQALARFKAVYLK